MSYCFENEKKDKKTMSFYRQNPFVSGFLEVILEFTANLIVEKVIITQFMAICVIRRRYNSLCHFLSLSFCIRLLYAQGDGNTIS